MDTVEIPSHFMENFVYDARTLQLFMKGQKDAKTAGKHAKALAKQVKEDRHLFGALDLELQVRPRFQPAAYFQTAVVSCAQVLHGFVTWSKHPSNVLLYACMLCVTPHGSCLEVLCR